jgi:alpha-L-fucosidase
VTGPYEPTWESVSTHPLPAWYDDAKLGIFVHWGLFSVPAWAPKVPDIQTMLVKRGPRAMLRENPYAEWYLNTMAIKGSPTEIHHRQTYGETFLYDDFAREFNEGTAECDLDHIAKLAEDAGAGYLVLTTKHSDGFCLWPSDTPHPVKGEYHARRDLVGALTNAVRARGLRMGLYYSGGYDWPYSGITLRRAADAILAVPADERYLAYVSAHWRELIERYAPSVLWNDIGWPPGGDLAGLFAEYYNAVPDGVINDRWVVSTIPRTRIANALVRSAGAAIEAAWPLIPAQRKRLTFPGARWCDVVTPEYETFDDVRTKKWETVRGVGHSFGANHNERPEDIITGDEVVRLLCDIVAKNGNLLIGVGPDAHGRVPDVQAAPLVELGRWLRAIGESIRGTRPWVRTSARTSLGSEVRFTQNDGRVYGLLFDAAAGVQVDLPGVDPASVASAGLLSTGEAVAISERDGVLCVELPARAPREPVRAIDLGPAVASVGDEGKWAT